MKKVLISLLLVLPALTMVWAATTNPSQINFKANIVLKTTQHQQSVSLASENWQGQDWLLLRQAIYHLGGTADWHGVTKKVILKGPSGRQAVLTTNMPKLVVERRRLIRLPHLPVIRQGSVWISAQSLEVIWRAIGETEAFYDANQRTFVVGARPLRENKTAQTKANQQQTKPAIVQPPKKDMLIVVDAGHGGRDPGAIGPTKLKEKTVTLEIAKQLAYYLNRQGLKVVMTRKDDRYIALRDRADLANRLKADLFVSVHANASRNRKAKGSQVFIYNREASSHHAASAAKLENQDANYLEIIKDDLRQSVHEVSSVNAAGLVSEQLERLNLNVRRIERAPFYVLAKSHMPSILVETAFISNYKEERLLRNKNFCKKLAQGIYHGLNNYHQELQPEK